MNSPSRVAKPSPLYRLALGVVAVTMAFLPACYLALAALAIYGTYFCVARITIPFWGASASYEMMAGGLGDLFLATFGPLFGLVVVVALLKPLLVKSTPTPEEFLLEPADETKLFGLVREVCRTLDAPTPAQIALDCSVNASASYTGGWKGLLERRLTLTLGLPLVAGLTQRELAGLVAHEVGHFRQRAGMGASFLIRSVNGWFERVIYGRDRFDRWLVHFTDGPGGNDPRILMVTGGARLLVVAARGILWLLMTAGRLVSTALLRQMEYDADRCEAHLAGTDAFASLLEKLLKQAAVWEDAHREMQRNWHPGHRAPENLPELVEAAATRMPPERRLQLEDEQRERKTRFLDTHPSPSSRLRRAQSAAEPGLGFSDAPARELFQRFEATSRNLTQRYYEKNLRLPVAVAVFVGTDEWLEERDRAEKAAQERRARLRRVATPRIQ